MDINVSFHCTRTSQEAIIRFAPQFEGTEQHDSQEFLSFLLDGLHEDLNLVHRRPPPSPEDPAQEARFEQLPDWEASGIAWEKYLKRNSSVIVSLFQGQFRNRLQCLTCGTVSVFITNLPCQHILGVKFLPYTSTSDVYDI